MEVLREIIRVARKPHRCCLCGCNIELGQRYVSQSCVDEDEFWEAKSHCECRTLASYLDMFDGCDDSLTEEAFRWCIEEYTEDKLNRNDPILNEELYEQVKLICEQLKLQSR